MIPEDGINNEELEAEFLALVGGQPQALEKLKGEGELKPPLRHFLSSLYGQGSEVGSGETGLTETEKVPALLQSTVWVKGEGINSRPRMSV